MCDYCNIINGMGYLRYKETHRDCNMAGVRKLSSAFSLTTMNNKPRVQCGPVTVNNHSK